MGAGQLAYLSISGSSDEGYIVTGTLINSMNGQPVAKTMVGPTDAEGIMSSLDGIAAQLTADEKCPGWAGTVDIVYSKEASTRTSKTTTDVNITYGPGAQQKGAGHSSPLLL